MAKWSLSIARDASCIAMKRRRSRAWLGRLLQGGSKLVLDLSGVRSMDSAGIGELALLQTWAQERNAELKFAGANELVRKLLCLTNLDSVLEVYPTLDAALESFRICGFARIARLGKIGVLWAMCAVPAGLVYFGTLPALPCRLSHFAARSRFSGALIVCPEAAFPVGLSIVICCSVRS